MDNIAGKATEHSDYGYTYDDLYRLAGADNPVQADEAFTYASVGNRLTAAGVADEWTTMTTTSCRHLQKSKWDC